MTEQTGNGPSLGTRILLLTSLVILITLTTVVAATWILSRWIAGNAIDEALARSVVVQQRSQEQLQQELAGLSGTFSDPYLLAYLAESAQSEDSASILDVLEERRDDFGFDFAMVLNGEGQLLARTDRPGETGTDLTQHPLITEALEAYGAEGVWKEERSLSFAIAGPLTDDFEQLLGLLVFGFEIDKAMASEIGELSGTDLAFISREGNSGQVVASTLSPELEADLANRLKTESNTEDWWDTQGEAALSGRRVDLELGPDSQRWSTILSPLLDARETPVGASVSLVPIEPQLRPFRKLLQTLLAVGILSLLLGLALSFALSRRILRPVRQLVSATEAARQGNYDQQLDVEQTGEVGTLASAFDDLLSDLREKRDMESYMTELSRTMPEIQATTLPKRAVTKELVLMALELRDFAGKSVATNPEESLHKASTQLRSVLDRCQIRGGRLEAFSGHRLLLSFAGHRRHIKALTAATEALEVLADSIQPPLCALASGEVASGSCNLDDGPVSALLGQPAQLLESLLRESPPGEIMLSTDFHNALRERLDSFDLPKQFGSLSPVPFHILPQGQIRSFINTQIEFTPSTTLMPSQVTLSGLEVGSILGRRFEILSILGEGGMGVVYKAKDRKLDDLVALKMLRRDALKDPIQLERLKDELKLARKITHPHVLRTFDFGEMDSVPFISMEYVRGVTLRYLLDRAQRLPFSAGLRLARQVCQGLAAAHDTGVIHRDIKPANIIVDAKGDVKLMDFGVARAAQRLAPGNTQIGMVVGTPQYLAPEQIEGEEPDIRVDIYALGVVLYEVFTGALPFGEAGDLKQVLFQHLTDTPTSPSQYWPEIPTALETAILLCLQKNPADRYPSMHALIDDLETLKA